MESNPAIRTDNFFRQFIRAFHGVVVRQPRWVVRGYLEFLSCIARGLDQSSVSRKILNGLYWNEWPPIDLRPRTVRVGERTQITLVPHIGEFDLEALVSKSLTYEPGCFKWIENNVASFDAIIEIGANVGVFTVLFDRVSRNLESKIRAIYAFEPSREAFRRLQQNLSANIAQNVQAFPCAVGASNEFVRFFEPQGHLTNGSLLQSFAGLFSNEVKENLALSISASSLEGIFSHFERVLLKIDVEGYEPNLLHALNDLLIRYRPFVMIEILDRTEAAVREILKSMKYQFHLITDSSLVRHDEVFASPQHRDWLLVPEARACHSLSAQDVYATAEHSRDSA